MTAKSSVSKTRKMEDSELIREVQKQYHAFRIGGCWECECGFVVMYTEEYKTRSRMHCPSCGVVINNFRPVSRTDFDSLEFDEIFRRYHDKIYSCCVRFRHIEDPDDTYCDMLHRFFVSVLTYDGQCKFSTYLWNNIRRRFEDFERQSSRICKNSAIQCQLCGRYVGAITRIHLMNNTVKPKKGFIGHKVLHEKIIDDIGREKFNALDNSLENKRAKEKWEGNRYSKRQNKLIKLMLVDAYRAMFPHFPLSVGHISISDSDPETNIEYGSMIQDNHSYDVNTRGFYITKNGDCVPESKVSPDDDVDFFLPEDINATEKDLCKEFAERITDVLHKKFMHYSKRKTFVHTKDKTGLQVFLQDILPYVSRGYDAKQIKTVFGYDEYETEFWLKKIKASKELHKLFNIAGV